MQPDGTWQERLLGSFSSKAWRSQCLAGGGISLSMTVTCRGCVGSQMSRTWDMPEQTQSPVFHQTRSVYFVFSRQGLMQPEPNSDGAEAAALCFQWRRNLQIHRAQQNSNPETDDLGLRKTSPRLLAPSLAPSSLKIQ